MPTGFFCSGLWVSVRVLGFYSGTIFCLFFLAFERQVHSFEALVYVFFGFFHRVVFGGIFYVYVMGRAVNTAQYQ